MYLHYSTENHYYLLPFFVLNFLTETNINNSTITIANLVRNVHVNHETR